MYDFFVQETVLGLVVAAIVGLVTFIMGVAWERRISPWMERKLYRDARVDGKWVAIIETEETAQDVESVVMIQTGHKIEGTISCISGPDKGREYNFVGTIRNQIVSAYYWSTSETSMDSGSFSMRLEGDGAMLNGHTSYYHDGEHTILSRPYKWTRKT